MVEKYAKSENWKLWKWTLYRIDRNTLPNVQNTHSENRISRVDVYLGKTISAQIFIIYIHFSTAILTLMYCFSSETHELNRLWCRHADHRTTTRTLSLRLWLLHRRRPTNMRGHVLYSSSMQTRQHSAWRKFVVALLLVHCTRIPVNPCAPNFCCAYFARNVCENESSWSRP